MPSAHHSAPVQPLTGLSPPAPRTAGRGRRALAGVPVSFLQARAETAGPEASSRTWVYRHVSTAIVEGLLWPGLRLPSARELARCWGVARGSVDEALMRLAREGLLERRAGRGSFVARRLPPGVAREVSGRAALSPQAGEALNALAPLVSVYPSRWPGAPRRLLLDPRVPDIDSFPLATWRRCLARAHAETDRASLCYGPPAGWPPLREATAHHLALTRGIECAADQVIILNGPLQSLDLVVRVLLERGDAMVVERPGYMSLARAVGLPPLELCAAPVDDQGLDIEAARRACPRPGLVFVHPLNQYPTGARLAAPRRQALLAWAREAGAWIIEGDHLGEIVYDGAVPAPLITAAAPRPGTTAPPAQVLFLGTFNGVMFPGLRLSYLVVPRRLVPAFTAVRGLFGDHPPLATQQALAAFIEEGHLSAHLRRVRGVYQQRRDAALALARQHLPPEVRLGPLLGGTHGCMHLPPGCDDELLAQQLTAQGFGVEMVSTYSWPQAGPPGLVYGFGADDPPRLEQGMARLGEVLRAALARSPAARRARPTAEWVAADRA